MPKSYGPWKRGPLSRVLTTFPGKLASHWLFQGVTYMDPTERRVKLGLDLIGASVLYPVARRWFSPTRASTAAYIAAHTASLLLNGQPLVVMKWHGGVNLTKERRNGYIRDLALRVGAVRGVAGVWLYGSLARGEGHPNSDIDVRVLRERGFANGVRVCLAVALERVRATIHRVPLDVYVWDSPLRAMGMRADETPIDLLLTERSGDKVPLFREMEPLTRLETCKA